MTDFLKLVGSRVRNVRKARGLTQEQLAERCGLQYTYIGGIERGTRNVSLATIEKLSDGLEVPPNELFKFDDSIPENLESNRALIEAYKSLLSNRSNEEISKLLNISKDILAIIDSQKK
ncbi:helix-turn-helix domain-containing protein [Pseudalkalibacillus decolorationis]|uniref:helix-turn-helix domain-containing protein n=1 Tax=Pseudalkalibacillus decolorationis TaxID=163879 RepID=UPI002147FA52|nr:helix-turn-helix transcriptional regulator [Pseudalkalibacillus decolorationis]